MSVKAKLYSEEDFGDLMEESMRKLMAKELRRIEFQVEAEGEAVRADATITDLKGDQVKATCLDIRHGRS